MSDHIELIRALGGPSKLGRDLGANARMWPSRGIPWMWRPVIARMASERGIEVPDGFLEPQILAVND